MFSGCCHVWLWVIVSVYVCVSVYVWCRGCGKMFIDGGQNARHHRECWECWMPFHNDLCLSLVCVREREKSERRQEVSKWP